MLIGSFTQQPADVLDYDIPYDVTEGDSVQSAVATVTPAGLTVQPPLVIPGNKVKLWVSGGTSGVTYKVEVTTTSTLGRVKQDELRFRVKDY